MQATGQEAELYFMRNYLEFDIFKGGVLEDARFLGDGFDFQIQVNSRFILAEIKGIRAQRGAFRLTENEYQKAREYKDDYGIIIVSNLESTPKMTPIFDPLGNLKLKKQTTTHKQVSYHSQSLTW